MESDLLVKKRFCSSKTELSFIEGPPRGRMMILLHGIGSRWQSFQPILPTLAKEYHVFAVDLRGHGGSGHTPGAYRLNDYTRDIHEFIAYQAGEAAVIYGHSLGALVAINLAAQMPEHVCSLILGDPPLYHHDTLTRDTFWQAAFMELLDLMLAHPDPSEMDGWLAQNYPNMPPERREERVRTLETLDPDVVRAVVSNTQMDGISLAALAPRVACPVLLLRGNPELGSALREQDVNFAVSSFEHLKILDMKTTGHGIIPENLVPELTDFIDGR